MMTENQFADMVTQYERLVYTICYQFTKNHHTSQDLAQETFLSAYAHRDTCQTDSAKAWIARIATNKAKDYLKSAYNKRVYADGDAISEEKRPMYVREESPADVLCENEGRNAIVTTIGQLKEPYNRVAVLYFVRDYSVDEIASELSRPKRTIQTQIYRAKRQLQNSLVPLACPA